MLDFLNPVEKSTLLYRTVLLIPLQTGSNSHIRNQIIHQRKIFRIKHLIRCCHTRLGSRGPVGAGEQP